MYENEDLWPLKCSHCLHEFTEKVGWLKTNTSVRCPDCKSINTYRPEEFDLALAKAQEGGLDPWRDMLRISK
jgi:hypothetical protein